MWMYDKSWAENTEKRAEGYKISSLSEACYPACVLREFPQPLRAKPEKCFKLVHDLLVSHHLQFLFVNHPIIRCYIFRASDNVVE
jgi:hypothetical protein